MRFSCKWNLATYSLTLVTNTLCFWIIRNSAHCFYWLINSIYIKGFYLLGIYISIIHLRGFAFVWLVIIFRVRKIYWIYAKIILVTLSLLVALIPFNYIAIQWAWTYELNLVIAIIIRIPSRFSASRVLYNIIKRICFICSCRNCWKNLFIENGMELLAGFSLLLLYLFLSFRRMFCLCQWAHIC